LAPAPARNPETALMIPGRSGHVATRRTVDMAAVYSDARGWICLSSTDQPT
jgi:hypothetical protein